LFKWSPIFHIVDYKDTEVMNTHICSPDKILDNFSLNQNTVLIIYDASIKNNLATSLLYIYSSQSILVKTIHHIFNITFTEAKLFLIRCGINQAIQDWKYHHYHWYHSYYKTNFQFILLSIPITLYYYISRS